MGGGGMVKVASENPDARADRRDLVGRAAAKLREVILAREPGAQIGSLNEVSDFLGVGIVTVQQAARVLEHEGLLTVRRGPGGGYYGARPDDAALERALATYLRVHCSARSEAREIITLIDCELSAAAADCASEEFFRVDPLAADPAGGTRMNASLLQSWRRIAISLDAQPPKDQTNLVRAQ
jgi:DNA-binding GntR family transcriptional regulator